MAGCVKGGGVGGALALLFSASSGVAGSNVGTSGVCEGSVVAASCVGVSFFEVCVPGEAGAGVVGLALPVAERKKSSRLPCAVAAMVVVGALFLHFVKQEQDVHRLAMRTQLQP